MPPADGAEVREAEGGKGAAAGRGTHSRTASASQLQYGLPQHELLEVHRIARLL
jgi:hypothetical protein